MISFFSNVKNYWELGSRLVVSRKLVSCKLVSRKSVSCKSVSRKLGGWKLVFGFNGLNKLIIIFLNNLYA